MTWANPAWQVGGQGWWQLLNLLVAAVLCLTIGLERELRYRDAGLRTQTLVGLGSALFTLLSKYGFGDVLGDDIMLDPSRVAAQIVSGVGFIGAGLIFVRRNAVRGLTTAAVVWLSAAVGAAAGAGLPLLAAAVTAGHFLVVYGVSPVARKLPQSSYAVRDVRIDYDIGEGTLRRVLTLCTGRSFVVEEVQSVQQEHEAGGRGPRGVSVLLRLRGKGDLAELAADIGEVPGVASVITGGGADGD
ncbi:MAG: MgtC/SapB family protein [Streptosporangiales bacterium]|nr:MgtC/SapB family protein [Streptosporangiales bacterium]